MRYPGLIILMLFFTLHAASQDRSINVITQSSWPPGSYVPVKIEIRNMGLNEFARFYQDLPRGFSVRRGETAGADFYWENSQVNFVWVKMPGDDIIRLTYLAKADPVLKGSFRLGGTLDYVVDGDKRESLEFDPVIVRLDPDAIVEENIEDYYAEEPVTDEAMPAETVVKKEAAPVVEYRVQVAISSEQITKQELEKRIGCSLQHDVTILRTGNMYKYQTGSFSTYAEASAYLDDLKKRGVNDAFLVAYRGDEQISISLARALSG